MPTNIWTYAGEAGKRLSDTLRPFTGDSPRLAFHSLDIDRLTWSVNLRKFVPSGEEYPEEGQSVTLFRNGQRFFQGTALRPDQNNYQMDIEVVGPWHWLERIPLSTDVALDAASGGGTGPRTTIGFPSQSMTISLGELIDRCIALGAPMIKGTIATTFSCIPIVLKNGSCADALVELVRLIGDMMVWFDYTGAGHPILNITRRLSSLAVGSAATVSLDAAPFTPGRFKVVSQDEMRVSQVRVPFINRKFDGTRLNQEQKAGTPEVGHVLILTASGQELDTFLPEDKLDSYVLQTVPTSGTAFKNWVLNKSGSVVAAGQVAGTPPQLLPLVMGPQTFNYQTLSSYLPATNLAIPLAAPSFVNEAGQPVSTVGKNLMVSDTLPEWLKDVYTVEPIKVLAPIAYEFKESTYVNNQPQGQPTLPTWWYSIQWSVTASAGFKGTSVDYSGYELFIHNAEIPAFLINVSAPSGSTIYKQPDYSFIQPPAGFADGILAARSFTPYKGTCGWVEQDCGATRYMGKLVNITGADPELSTMRAMVQSETLELRSGATTLQLGPPARLSFPTLLNQVRANSNEQIQYL